MTSRKMFAITVGKKPVVPINHFYMRPDLTPPMSTQFYFWCIVDEKHGVILVDQSFSKQCLEEMRIDFDLRLHPLALLQTINVSAEDVRHVILSHLHWDHYAGDDFFPNARYYVHQKEIEYVTGPLMQYRTYSQHYNFKAVEKLLHHLFTGRASLLQNDCESPLEGITCLRTGGHTPGLMSVAVLLENETKVICSDVAPRYQNIAETTPCGIHYDVTEALRALEKLSQTAGCLENILPGHDPALTERYAEAAPGVYRIG